MTHRDASITSEDTLGLHNVNKLPGPQFTNRDARENAALACKIYIMQISATPGTFPLTLYGFLPLFPPQSLPGASFPQSSAGRFHAAAPSARHAPPVPRGRSPHSPSLLAGCCAGMAGHTRGNRVPASKNLQRRALYPHCRCWSQVFSPNPGQRKTRASLSRENPVISRYFVIPAPAPAPRGARFGSENAPGLVKGWFGPLSCRSRRLPRSVLLVESA